MEQSDFDATDAEAHARPSEPRLHGRFPAQVRGVDSSGATFHTQTVLDNFGAMEFDLSLARRVEEGRRLLVVVDIHEATVALHGNVRRAESQADGSHRMTVAVTHHRFLLRRLPRPASRRDGAVAMFATYPLLKTDNR